MERSKLEKIFKDRFPNNDLDHSLIKDYDILLHLVADDLKRQNLSYAKIKIRYNVSIQTARSLKHRINNTKKKGAKN